MTETFDAVLADARLELKHSRPTYAEIEGYFDRLQSAHEAEVAGLRADRSRWENRSKGWELETHRLARLLDSEESRADRAVGLLRECRPLVDTCPDLVRPGGDELGERIDAFLSEQAGERENATKDSAHED